MVSVDPRARLIDHQNELTYSSAIGVNGRIVRQSGALWRVADCFSSWQSSVHHELDSLRLRSSGVAEPFLAANLPTGRYGPKFRHGNRGAGHSKQYILA